MSRSQFALVMALVVSYSCAAQAATVGLFTGADPGEGLDFNGTFTYAVDIAGGSTATIGSATFTPEASTVGFTSSATASTTGGLPNYGATAGDNSLESIMASLDYEVSTFAIDLSMANLVAGHAYKYQVLFYSDVAMTPGQRVLDLYEEGTKVFDDMQMVLLGHTGGGGSTNSVVWGGTFNATVGNTILNLRIEKDSTSNPYTAIVSAVTLEDLGVPPAAPEPGMLPLIGLGSMLLARKRKGKSSRDSR